MNKRVKKVSVPPPTCGYGCGKPSEGYLMLSFSEWLNGDKDRDYNRGFNATLPACRACLRGAISIKVTIPDVKP